MIATFIFCCLFIFSNIKNGQSNDSIVDNMNQLFKQNYWKEYLLSNDIELKDGHNNFVTIFANTIDAESGELCVTEANVNEKKRAAYMIVHYHYSYMFREIVFMFIHMINENVLLNVIKQCLDKLDTTFSKIESSLSLLSSGYEGDDLPNLVQISIVTLKSATNKAYEKFLEPINNNEVDMSNILNNFLKTVKNIWDSFNQFLKGNGEEKEIHCHDFMCKILDKILKTVGKILHLFDEFEKDGKQKILEYFWNNIYYEGIDLYGFKVQWYFFAFLEYDISKFYENTGFKYNEETKTSSINQTQVEPLDLYDIDFEKLNLY